MGKRYLLLIGLLMISFATAWTRPVGVESVSEPGFELRSRSSIPYVPSAVLSNDITYFGGTTWAPDSMRWEAVKDSVWTFDSGVGSAIIEPGKTYPNVNPFKPVGFHATMEGWVGVDLTYGAEHRSFFRRISALDPRWGANVCVGTPAGLGGNYSFWAGAFQSEADSLCYVSGQGYGNFWVLCIGQIFGYTTGGVTLGFDTVVETESGYDFATVEIDTSCSGGACAGDIVEAVAYDGSVVGLQNLSLTPGLELPIVSSGEIQIRFCFGSDGAWSDQDGLNPTTCGAFAVDNVSISGGSISHSADFEADDGGWSLLPPFLGVGDFSRLVSLNDLPAIPGNVEGSCTLADSVLVFYDPASDGHPVDQDNLALSPWIDLERAGLEGTPGKALHFEGFFDLPLTDYVLTRAVAQWLPDTCQISGAVGVSPLAYSSFSYFASPVCLDEGASPIDLSAIIPPHATQIRIGIDVVNHCRFFGNCTGLSNITPWFDNVRFALRPFLNLQDLIDSASPGDTIQVSPGTYTGAGNRDLDFGGKNLVMLAPSGPDSTVIDCQGSGRGFIFQSGEDSTSVVEGFTIINGEAGVDSVGQQQNGGGMLILGTASPVIRNCILRLNSGNLGGGLSCEGNAFVENCVFTENVGRYGGGISTVGASEAIIHNCEISNNVASWVGGGIYADGAPTVTQCNIINNSAVYLGGGIHFLGDGLMTECTISGNQANQGGGLSGTFGLHFCYSSPLIKNCIISGNTAVGSGGGAGPSCFTLESCTISGNSSGGDGGGVYGVTSVNLLDCIVSENTAGGGGGGIYLSPGQFFCCRSTASGCTISGNSANEGGGVFAVSAYSSPSPEVINSIITGNEAGQGGGIVVYGTPTFSELPPVSFFNSTISGNHSVEGGAVYLPSYASVDFSYSILWGNCARGKGGDEIFFADSTGNIQFTCSAVDTTGFVGDGTIQYSGPQVFDDPLFCSSEPCRNAPTTAGDYRLAANSPCIPSNSPCDSLIGATGETCTTTSLPPDDPSLSATHGIEVYPNPFAVILSIRYEAPENTKPLIEIFDVNGRLVKSYDPIEVSTTLVWDGKDNSGRRTAPGVYFIRFRAGKVIEAKRVVQIQ